MDLKQSGRRFLVGAALLAAFTATQAAAQAPTAQAFVEGIYRPYLQQGFPGQPYEQTARFFAP